jgi:hypothetical protein
MRTLILGDGLWDWFPMIRLDASALRRETAWVGMPRNLRNLDFTTFELLK